MAPLFLSTQSPSSTGVRGLFSITLIYTLLPSFLFLGGWLKWYWAIPCILLWLILCYQTLSRELRTPEESVPPPRLIYLFLPLIAIYVTYATGVGGFVGQSQNYVGWDNLKLYDLIVYPWPVVYPEKQAFYCYYIGYFLPIAALTKIAANINLAEYFAFIWAWMGVTLCLFWVYTLLQVRYAWMVILFLLTGGLSVAVITFNTLDLKYLRFGEDISYPYPFISTWWTGTRILLDTTVPFNCSLRYASTTTTMAWAPYHYISGILFPAMIWYKIIDRKTFASVPLVLGAGLIWSPFVLLGLIPMVLYGMWKYMKQVFLPETLLSVIPAIPFLIYYAAHSPSSDMTSGFIWDCGRKWWINYLAFVGIEVGIFWSLIVILKKRYLTSSDVLPVKLNVIPLVLIPLVYLGFYNDFPVKAGIAPLFFLTTTFVRLICRIVTDIIEKGIPFFNRKNFFSILALFVWLLSTVIPVNILLHPVFPHPLYDTKTRIAQPFVSDTIRNLSENMLSSQFLGDLNNPAYSKIFKQLKTTKPVDEN